MTIHKANWPIVILFYASVATQIYLWDMQVISNAFLTALAWWSHGGRAWGQVTSSWVHIRFPKIHFCSTTPSADNWACGKAVVLWTLTTQLIPEQAWAHPYPLRKGSGQELWHVRKHQAWACPRRNKALRAKWDRTQWKDTSPLAAEAIRHTVHAWMLPHGA